MSNIPGKRVGRDTPQPRDRAVAVSSEECPTCHAPVGEQCKSASGKKVRHDARRRKALRAEGLTDAQRGVWER